MSVIGFAIVACEIGFWVVLGTGLLLRYALGRQRASTAVLLAVPLVDVVLLAVTAIDLRRGTEPNAGHGLAALYLGFSVAFGHDLVRWADQRVAHHFRGTPLPPKPAGGTVARMREEWRAFGLGLVGYAVAAVVVLGLIQLTRHGSTDPLRTTLLGPVVALVVWLVGWPVTETVRVLSRRNRTG